jgi:hypothetical protein
MAMRHLDRAEASAHRVPAAGAAGPDARNGVLEFIIMHS